MRTGLTSFRRFEHRLQPAQHRQRQDHFAVLMAPVVIPKDLFDPPDVVDTLLMAAAHVNLMSSMARVDVRTDALADVVGGHCWNGVRVGWKTWIMTKNMEITGNPKTGRWKVKYKGRTHKCPVIARTKSTNEVPQPVIDWIQQEIVNGRFR